MAAPESAEDRARSFTATASAQADDATGPAMARDHTLLTVTGCVRVCTTFDLSLELARQHGMFVHPHDRGLGDEFLGVRMGFAFVHIRFQGAAHGIRIVEP